MIGRTILHVDMDAFYASVEQRENPDLRGLPVIVGGPKDARGVVSAASYEARKFGVKSAMPLRIAARLCPRGQFVPVRMKLYQTVSRQVFGIFKNYSPLVEPLSVDEAFLDLTGCERLFGSAIEAARALREEVRKETQLTASVGVAPNKFLAKIASDLDKPDGLVVVPRDDTESFLAPLPIERMWGVGPVAAARLHKIGIRTFGDMQAAGPRRMRELFGTHGPTLLDLAAGRDARAVTSLGAPKSVGHETTFSVDVDDEDVLHGTLVALTDAVAARLRGHGLKARTVTIKIRDASFRTVTRRRTLVAPTCVTDTLLHHVLELWEREVRLRGPIRLLGVSTSGFSAQAMLFEEPGDEGREELDTAVDRVRDRYGRTALRRASTMRESRQNRGKSP
ncbi:MAG: DNA polymerase IV [Planctomycetota bacterium]